MEDQHNGLVQRGIKSYHFKEFYPVRKLDEAFRNLRYGKYKFAFIAPERLSNPLFREYISNADISLLAVDEAHCISQWGFDFRPAYLNIQKIKELLPEIPTIALTASATKQVKKDLLNELRIPDAKIFEASIFRENLILNRKFTPNKEKQILRLLNQLKGTGIIYAKTRRTCEQLSNLLNKEGFNSSYYHAGVDQARHRHRWHIDGEGQVERRRQRMDGDELAPTGSATCHYLPCAEHVLAAGLPEPGPDNVQCP